jgi:hypothetical protein
VAKRNLILSGLGIVACLVVGFYFWAHPSGPGVTPANFSRLHVGMPRAEVEAILGETGEFQFRFTGNYFQHWEGKDCAITLRISEFLPCEIMDGTLHTPTGSRKLGEKQECFLDVLRRWLGL